MKLEEKTWRTASRARHPALTAGLYWGAIWGLYEATVGWLVHFLPRVPGTAGVLMVPFAVFCLDRARRASGGAARAALIAALAAAAIKLVDASLPVRALHTVINPALAILLQGVAFVVVARRLDLARRLPSLRDAALGALAFSVGWRLLFLLYSALVAWGWSLGLLRDGLHTVPNFLVRDGLVSAAAVLAVMALVYGRRRAVAAPGPLPGRLTVAALLVLAVAVEIAVGLAHG